jgi:CBS domain-containing protein
MLSVDQEWKLMAGTISVRDVMVKDVRMVRMDTSVQEVVATMNKFDISSIIVMQGERPVGIITERDILRRIIEQSLAPQETQAKYIMTTPMITVQETVSIDEAARLMAKRKIKKLPVMNGDKLVGILTFTDIAFKVPTLLSLLEEIVRPYRRVQ